MVKEKREEQVDDDEDEEEEKEKESVVHNVIWSNYLNCKKRRELWLNEWNKRNKKKNSSK